MTLSKYFKSRTHAYPLWVYSGVAVLAFLFLGDELHAEEQTAPPAPLTVEARKALVPDTGWTRVWDSLGQGGPEEGYLSIETPPTEFEDPETHGRPVFITASGPLPSVEKVNYFNYANAILPTTSSEISSDFGWRTAPCKGCSSDHKGVDFVPGNGEPVFAVLDGLVTEAGWNGGYGYWVKVEHRVTVDEEVEFWETVYAHMQKDSIPEEVYIGAVVKKGDLLGKVGNTGVSTGPHLHFELRIDGEEVDPIPLISPNQVVSVRQYELAGVGEVRELVIEYR